MHLSRTSPEHACILKSLLDGRNPATRDESLLVQPVRVDIDALFPMKLKTERSGYEECVGVTRLLLKLLGVWPLSHGKGNFFKRSYVCVAPSLIFIILIVPQTKKLLSIWRDLNAVIDILSIGLMIVIICFFKFLRIWQSHADFTILLEGVRNDWQTATKDEQITMWKYARYSRIIATVGICSLLSNCHMLHFWFYVQYLSERKQLAENLTMWSKPYCMSTDFYFDVQYTSPIYQIIVFLMYVAVIQCCLVHGGYDSVFVLLMLHYTALFENLRVKIETLVQDNMDGRFLFVDVLVPLVNRHQYLCRYTALIEKIFSDLFLLQIMSAAIHLCLQGYEFVVIMSKNGMEELPELMFIIFYSYTSLFCLFIYCFIAEQLRSQSGELFTSIYKMRWYELSSRESKLLLMMLIRTEKPVNITAGKFEVLSLEYFCKILKFCSSFFSVLLAARDKIISD